MNIASKIISFPRLVCNQFLSTVISIGKIGVFAIDVLRCMFGRFFFMNFVKQSIEASFFSLSLISVTGFFSGAVLSLQSYTALERFGATGGVPAIVVLSLVRELGPVLSALMINSRVGSRVTAELGGMVITNQISAMKFLSVNPLKFLIIPRVLSTVVATVASCMIFTIMGCIGGYLVCVYIMQESHMEIIVPAVDILKTTDLYSAIVKASVFGVIIGFVSSYFGYHVEGGAVVVGSATTNTIVIATMVILFANYILTSVMF